MKPAQQERGIRQTADRLGTVIATLEQHLHGKPQEGDPEQHWDRETLIAWFSHIPPDRWVGVVNDVPLIRVGDLLAALREEK